mmetsp:Transcript_1959/g.7538  ORF Transcript_1959/g.7538 Transcript_1959/m.7538 type:complete len:300 (-) Transcript_1959:184-1083(-)
MPWSPITISMVLSNPASEDIAATTARTSASFSETFRRIAALSTPNVCPAWSTPRKCPMSRSHFSGTSSLAITCCRTPLSTVSRSLTLNDGNGVAPAAKCVARNSSNHVSSPANATRRPFAAHCAMTLSSLNTAPPKLLLTSTNVGKPPVKIPFSLCCVVVGGSATNRNSSLVTGPSFSKISPIERSFANSSGSFTSASKSRVRCNSEAGAAKSKRAPSIINTTTLSKGVLVQQPASMLSPSAAPRASSTRKSPHALLSVSSTRVKRKPDAKTRRATSLAAANIASIEGRLHRAIIPRAT